MSRPIFASALGPTASIALNPGEPRPTVHVDLSPDATWPVRYHIEVTTDAPDVSAPSWRPYGVSDAYVNNPPGVTTSSWFPLMEDGITGIRAHITSYIDGRLELYMVPQS